MYKQEFKVKLKSRTVTSSIQTLKHGLYIHAQQPYGYSIPLPKIKGWLYSMKTAVDDERGFKNVVRRSSAWPPVIFKCSYIIYTSIIYRSLTIREMQYMSIYTVLTITRPSLMKKSAVLYHTHQWPLVITYDTTKAGQFLKFH